MKDFKCTLLLDFNQTIDNYVNSDWNNSSNTIFSPTGMKK
jgi:hypothetical protein